MGTNGHEGKERKMERGMGGATRGCRASKRIDQVVWNQRIPASRIASGVLKRKWE